MKKRILHYISVLGIFMMLYGILYYVQSFSIGLLPIFDKVLFNFLPLNFVVFSISSILFIIKFVKINSHYAD